MRKTILNFCPTGMIPTKEMTPYVPVLTNEIIEQTHEAFELGITLVHLHVRDQNGVPSYKKADYFKVFEGIRKHCPDLVLCASTSGRNCPEFEKRSEVIELKPDMCSLTLSSLNFVKQASVNSPDIIRDLALKMKAHGVTPELECFDLGMINYGKYLLGKEFIGNPVYWNLIFGNIAGFQASLDQVAVALQQIPNDHFVGMGGLGNDQLKINSLAIAMGYGVRVGIEDNIWWDKEKGMLTSNIGLVKRVHQLIELNEKELFPSKEFGELGFYNTLR